MEKDIPNDFRELCESLNARRVRYLIIGGYAVAFHGHPRYTKDLDLLVDSERDNIVRLLAALADFGMGSLGLRVEDFSNPEGVLQIGYPPLRVDILTSVSGVEFADAYDRRDTWSTEGADLPVIDLESLRRSKLATGRPEDLADLRKLRDN